MPVAGAERRQSVQSLGGYSRKDGDDLDDAVYALSGPLLLLVCGSLLHTAASVDFCVNVIPLVSPNGTCTEINGYSVALGLISTLGLIGFFAAFSVVQLRERLPEKSLYYMSILLLLWWGFGVAITTFQNNIRPDLKYFSAWGCLLLSTYIARREFEQFALVLDRIQHMDQHSRSIFYLALTSLIVTASSIAACINATCEPKEAFGIAVSLVAFALTILLWRLNVAAEDIATKLAIVLSILWFFSLCVLTLLGPFTFASNGFFASCASFILAFSIAHGLSFPFSIGFGPTTQIQQTKSLNPSIRFSGPDGIQTAQKHVFFMDSSNGEMNTVPVDPSTMKAENRRYGEDIEYSGSKQHGHEHDASSSTISNSAIFATPYNDDNRSDADGRS